MGCSVAVVAQREGVVGLYSLAASSVGALVAAVAVGTDRTLCICNAHNLWPNCSSTMHGTFLSWSRTASRACIPPERCGSRACR